MNKKVIKRIAVVAGALAVTACARVELGGPIIGATVSIFHSSQTEAIYTTQTTEWGGPNRKEALLVAGGGFIDLRQEDFSQYTGSGYFIAEASGGQRWGNDLTGAQGMPEDFTGTVHVIVPARDTDIATGRLNGMTEVIYQTVKPMIDAGLPDAAIIGTLDQLGASLVNSDIDGDGVINYRDLLISSYYDAAPLEHSQDALVALSHAVFDGDAAAIAKEVGSMASCNYTQVTPGGEFEVCETSHDPNSCADVGGTFAVGSCPVEGAVGVCAGDESSIYYYTGEADTISFGCNFVPGGQWTTF